MPSKLINDTLSSLSGGVTQQYQEGRFDSQVQAMENCIPSITRGVLRRNPVNYVSNISILSDLSRSFVYTYDRGTLDEQYMVIVNGAGSIYVFDIITGAPVEVHGPDIYDYLKIPVGAIASEVFKAITIGDHTFIVNTTIQTSFTSDVGSSSGYSDMAFYWIKKTASVITEQEQTSTAVGNKIAGYTYTLNNKVVESGIDTRPTAPTAPIDLGTSYKIATAMAGTGQVAEEAVVYQLTEPTAWDWSDTFGDEASIGVWKDVDSSDKLPANLPSALDGFLVKVSGGTSAEFDDYYLKYSHTDKTWKETVKPGALTTLDPTTMPHVLYRLGDGTFSFDTYQTLETAIQEIKPNGDLATGTWFENGTPISTAPYTTGTQAVLQNSGIELFYGAAYRATIDLTNQISGGGYTFLSGGITYPLTIGVVNTIDFIKGDNNVLNINVGTTALTIDSIKIEIISGTFPNGVSSWGTRESGGGDVLQDPSFLGVPIINILFFKNRLGFLTKDNIILSQTGDYGDFFIQTVQAVLDDDPIDLAVASTDVTVLRHAVPTAGQLILFADDTQFSIRSVDGPLTPNTADITAISNYTYGNRAPAMAIGNRVLFSNQAGGYSQIYSYKVTDRGSQVTEASPMTLHLPSFIDSSIERIIGHDVLGFTFFQTDDDRKKLTILTSVTRGKEDLQNAFHTWTFKHDIVSTHIINNDLYILFSTASTTGILTKIHLNIPGNINDESYMDDYDGITPEEYQSSLVFSKFTMRDKTGKGTVRGRYQVRTLQYTITDDSKYITNIFSTNQSLLDPATMMGPTWVDTDIWDDTKIWVDVDPFYSREYTNDDKVTVMSDSEKVLVTFKSSTEEPSKGFELATANIEAFFYQRSTRI